MGNKRELLRLNIQHFAVQQETFDPDNVMLQDARTGEIPSQFGGEIIKDVIENSKVMQLGIYEPMDKQEKKFDYLANGPGAYWVGEGQRIQTSKAEWLQVTMKAKKVAVILVASREMLQYSMTRFFEEMKPKIAEAFHKKFDEAAILNYDNPFEQSIEQSVIAADNVAKVALDGNGILELEGLVEDNDYEPNAFISKRQNRSTLRGVTEGEGVNAEKLYDRKSNELDGLPVVDLKSDQFERGHIYTGDFDQIRYGIPFNISYNVSEEAQLSTVLASDGQPVNLYEQELIALRATMDIGFMVIKDEAFAKLEATESVVDPEGA